MDTLRQLSVMIIWLIRVGIGYRVAISFYKMMHEEDGSIYKKRTRNALIFYVFAESAFQLKDIAIYYFKYGGKGGPM